MSHARPHDEGGGDDSVKIQIPFMSSRRKARPVVLLIPAGILAALLSIATAWLTHDHSGGRERVVLSTEERLEALEKAVDAMRPQVNELAAKEAERQRAKEIEAAVKARLAELADRVGPGTVH